MKRILAAILVLSLLFAFCGCTGKEEKDNKPSESVVIEENDVEPSELNIPTKPQFRAPIITRR